MMSPPVPPDRLTATDIARSRTFYEQVFGFAVAYVAPAEDADRATHRGRLTSASAPAAAHW